MTKIEEWRSLCNEINLEYADILEKFHFETHESSWKSYEIDRLVEVMKKTRIECRSIEELMDYIPLSPKEIRRAKRKFAKGEIIYAVVNYD